MPVSAQETTHVFDRGIKRIADPHFCFHLCAIILGAVFGSITEMSHLVIGEKDLAVVGNTVDDRVTDTGICAAIFALALTGTSINIYSQIGVLMLIGIMAKNAILMVEFADQLRESGADITMAARKAATVRLRPITMTMVLSAMPR